MAGERSYSVLLPVLSLGTFVEHEVIGESAAVNLTIQSRCDSISTDLIEHLENLEVIMY